MEKDTPLRESLMRPFEITGELPKTLSINFKKVTDLNDRFKLVEEHVETSLIRIRNALARSDSHLLHMHCLTIGMKL